MAARAGVSIKTVSRVLNDSPDVHPRTRAAVQRAMRDLDYVADIHARRLAGHQLRVVGLLIPALASVYSFYLYDIVRGVVDQAEDEGYQVLIIPSESRLQTEDHYVRFLRAGHVRGLVVVPRPQNVTHVLQLAGAGLPAIAIDDGVLCPAVAGVTADNRGGARAAVDHLLGLGHRRIAHIAGDPQYGCSHERVAGYREALAAAERPDHALVVWGDFTKQTGAGLSEQLLDCDRPPTAIFCANDRTALGVLEAAHRRGLVIGRDLAVVGFDDTYDAAEAVPALTTVHQPLYETGRRAVQLLLAHVEDRSRSTGREVLPCRLVVRASCGGVAVFGRDDGFARTTSPPQRAEQWR